MISKTSDQLSARPFTAFKGGYNLSITINRLKTNDISFCEELVKIEAEAFGEGGLNLWGLVPMIYHGAVYVINFNNRPVGLSEYMRDMNDPGLAYLYGLAVKEEYQKEGLASSLLDYSLQDLKNKGISKVQLTVDVDNEAALYLYQKKFGFSKIEYRKDEYGRGEDRLIMELRL